MTHRFIAELTPGETIDGIYMVNNPILRSTSRGDFYIAMYLCDKTGQINGRMWQATPEIYESIPKPGFISIQGRSELYQNNLQLIVNRISVVDPDSVDTDDFLAKTDKDVAKIFEETKQILRTIQNNQIKTLLAEYFEDNTLMTKFQTAPGGMRLHHSCIGGLLEHTWNMLRVAKAILPLYPDVEPDLVLAGIFIHDMGKTEELSYDMAFDYTDSGQLIGHISKSLLILHEKANLAKEKNSTIDDHILDLLGHIILSHHGQYEFGSPKLPATPEAFMINYIDNMDAKINQVTNAIVGENSDNNWTAWQKSLETRLYRKKLDQEN